MTKFWRVAWHEYSRHVFRKRFLLALFSVPLMIIFMVILVIAMIIMETNSKPVGYLDRSGILADPVSQPPVKWPEKIIPMVAYTDENTALTDLKAEKLQAYYIIPEDYLTSGHTQVVYLNKLKGADAACANAGSRSRPRAPGKAIWRRHRLRSRSWRAR